MPIKDNVKMLLKETKNIALVCVTKSKSTEEIKKALESGIKIIAENRIKEAGDKYGVLKPYLEGKNIGFHFIGKLQSNKVKKAVSLFDVIQSVDSLAMAEKIDRAAGQQDKIQEIFLEINIGKEKQKSGVMPEYAVELIDNIKKLRNIAITGLMCIPPYKENPEDSRKYFRDMKQLFDKAKLEHLSMGMTNDYRVAIEEGSNMVRIGRGIFDN